MRVRIGTSGFSYKEWKPSFYPKELKQDGMLRYYGERFDTVEINNTFYRMPTRELLEGWAAEVPETFSFVLKASQRITHHKKIAVADVADTVARLYEMREALGARKGPVLFQLPPYLKKDIPRLVDFLAIIPKGGLPVIEITKDWHSDDTFHVLEKAGAALCIVDDDKKDTPLIRTAAHGYLRLRRVEYAPADLERWRDRILAEKWDDAWLFFKHEDAGTGPKLAASFRALIPA